MAERRPLRCELQFQYLFDRLLPDKLEQVYQLLVPDHARPIGCYVGDCVARRAINWIPQSL